MLFYLLYEIVLTVESENEILKSLSVTIQMKVTERYFYAVLFVASFFCLNLEFRLV